MGPPPVFCEGEEQF